MNNKLENAIEFDQFEKLITGLIENNYSCCDDFIDASTTSGLRDNLLHLNETGELQESGIGNKNDFRKNKLVRGDKIKWLNENSTDQYESIVQKKIGNFISHLNSTCFTSINQFESHYASYGIDSFYKRHLDQFKTDSDRQFSIILYLNQNWKDADNGTLSLYPKNMDQVDISPIEGRLVFFKSDEMEHEVHPSTTRVRQSIAGWMKSK